MAKKTETQVAPTDGLSAEIERSYERGDYARVRALSHQAHAAGGAAQVLADQRMETVKLDKITVACGVAALLVVLCVAALTLGG
jgi:hypothetical protein